VAVVGSEGAGDWFYESPVYFPQASSGDALLQSGGPIIAAVAVPQGITKVATITCVEVQVCRDAHESAPEAFRALGMEVVYQAQASLAQPDFTAQCVGARDRGAQAMLVAMDANAVRAVAQACARQRFFPLYSFSAGQTTSALGSDPNLEGALVTSNVAPWTTSDTPGTAEFQEAMATYAPGVTPTGGHMQGWVAGKVFELGTRALPAEPTAADVVAGLGQLNGDLLADLTAPLLFRPGQPSLESVCSFAVRIEGGAFVTSDAGRVCRDFQPT
jgi:branched-chain amino acid transport system substrate-binding protein